MCRETARLSTAFNRYMIQNACIYARVSKDDNSQSVMNQVDQLEDYCKAKGWMVVRKYIDQASGKGSADRTQFQLMMAETAQHPFDVVVVWALDRFTREGVFQTFAHVQRLMNHGIAFESFKEEHFRTTGSFGPVMLAIAAWIAEQECKRIVERTLAGLERARKAGKHIGRPHLVLDRTAIRQMVASGTSLRRTAAHFGVDRSTITAIVRSAAS